MAETFWVLIVADADQSALYLSPIMDMQQTFKIISGKEEVDQSIWFIKVNEERSVRTRLAEGGLNLDQQARNQKELL